MTTIPAYRDTLGSRLLFVGSVSERLAWGLLLLFVLSMMLSIAVVQATVVLLCALWIGRLTGARSGRLHATLLDIPILAFIGARLISIFFSSHVARSVHALYTEVFFYSVFFIVTDILSVREPARLKILFRALFVAAAIAAVIGISKVALLGAVRASSATSGYYSLGLYLSAVCALVLVLGREERFFPQRYVWALLCLLFAAGIILTYNRIHWVTLAYSLVVVGIARERKVLLLAVLLGAASVIFIPSIQDRFFQLVHLTSHLSDRDVLWRGAVMRAGEHVLLGFGPRSFPDVFPLFGELQDKGIGGWHNDYIQVYMESGIIGLLAFLWMIVSVLYHGVRALKRTDLTAQHRTLIAGILLAVSVFFIAGGVFDTVVSLLFWFLVAVLAQLLGNDAGLRPTAVEQVL